MWPQGEGVAHRPEAVVIERVRAPQRAVVLQHAARAHRHVVQPPRGRKCGDSVAVRDAVVRMQRHGSRDERGGHLAGQVGWRGDAGRDQHVLPLLHAQNRLVECGLCAHTTLQCVRSMRSDIELQNCCASDAVRHAVCLSAERTTLQTADDDARTVQERSAPGQRGRGVQQCNSVTTDVRHTP